MRARLAKDSQSAHLKGLFAGRDQFASENWLPEETFVGGERDLFGLARTSTSASPTPRAVRPLDLPGSALVVQVCFELSG